MNTNSRTQNINFDTRFGRFYDRFPGLSGRNQLEKIEREENDKKNPLNQISLYSNK